MNAPTTGPRLIREGWVPASNTSRSRKSAMAIPKTSRAGAPYGVIPTAQVGRAITEVTPYEKYALRLIVDSADLIEVEEGQTFLIVPAEPELIDALATIGAEQEDLEDGGDYERTDPALDNAFSSWFSGSGYAPTDGSDDEPGTDKEADSDGEPFVNYLP